MWIGTLSCALNSFHSIGEISLEEILMVVASLAHSSLEPSPIMPIKVAKITERYK